MLRRIAVSAIAAAASTACLADTFTFGELGVGINNADVVSHTVAGYGVTFTDYINFIFPSGSTGSGQAVANELVLQFPPLGTILDLKDVSIGLYSGSDGSGSQIGSTVNTFGSFGFTGLTVGESYSFKLSATTNGSTGGTYAFSAYAVPVPEPTAAAMLIAGFAVMGFIAMRRRRQD